MYDWAFQNKVLRKIANNFDFKNFENLEESFKGFAQGSKNTHLLHYMHYVQIEYCLFLIN